LCDCNHVKRLFSKEKKIPNGFVFMRKEIFLWYVLHF